MTTQDIASKLVAYCREGNFEKALDELFAQDAVSIEQHATPDFEKETKGMDAIRQKGEKWNKMVEKLHSVTVSEPLVAPNSFACILEMNVTMHQHGDVAMKELCVYTVKDGKIVSEEFFM